MKRHEALQPISRDHHEVLMLARDLRRLEEDPALDAVAARASLERSWTSWMGEFIGASAASLAGLTGPAHLRARMADGAGQIAVAVGELLEGEDTHRSELARLGERLRDEVRWRERVLFPVLEASATAEEWAHLGARWRAIEAGRPRSKGSCETE